MQRKRAIVQTFFPEAQVTFHGGGSGADSLVIGNPRAKSGGFDVLSDCFPITDSSYEKLWESAYEQLLRRARFLVEMADKEKGREDMEVKDERPLRAQMEMDRNRLDWLEAMLDELVIYRNPKTSRQRAEMNFCSRLSGCSVDAKGTTIRETIDNAMESEANAVKRSVKNAQ